MKKQEFMEIKSLHGMKKSSSPEHSPSSDGLGNQSALSQLGTHIGAQPLQAKKTDSPVSSAFDSQSGQTLSPMSAGGGSFSTAAPIQAKKGKKEIPQVPQGPTSQQLAAEDRDTTFSTASPSELAALAISSERANSIATMSRGRGWTGVGSTDYDYDADQERISNALNNMDDDGRSSFKNSLADNLLNSLYANTAYSPMFSDGFNRIHSSFRALNKHADDESTSLLADRSRVLSPRGENSSQYEFGFDNYQKAMRYKPQTIDEERTLLGYAQDELRKLNTGKIFRWRRGGGIA